MVGETVDGRDPAPPDTHFSAGPMRVSRCFNKKRAPPCFSEGFLWIYEWMMSYSYSLFGCPP